MQKTISDSLRSTMSCDSPRWQHRCIFNKWR